MLGINLYPGENSLHVHCGLVLTHTVGMCVYMYTLCSQTLYVNRCNGTYTFPKRLVCTYNNKKTNHTLKKNMYM